MAVSPDAIRFLDSQFCQNLNTVYLEGDRLGSEKFLSEVLKRYSLTVYKTIVSEEILKRRHEFRGDTQSESWLKGRASKVKKVSETFQAKPLFNQNPEELSNAIEILFLERV